MRDIVDREFNIIWCVHFVKNRKRWYEFMGDAENPYAPFQMNYVYDIPDQWGDDPWDPETKNCSEAYDVS